MAVPKKKSVFFLGAGCSAAFGYPITSSILPNILKEIDNGHLFYGIPNNDAADERKKEQRLKAYILNLYPGIAEQTTYNGKNLPNITEVLSLTDYLIEIGAVPSSRYKLDDVVQCRQLLHRAICEVLYKSQEDLFAMEKTNETLRLFLDLLQKEVRTKELSIITTNYDTLIELLLLKRVYEQGRRAGNSANNLDFFNLLNCIDFGTNFRDPFENKVITQPQNPLFRFFKLHGSFTWLKCDLCEHIFINPYGDIVFQAYRDEVDEYNTCHCNDVLQLRTLIVAPSLVRDIKDPNLLHIWKNTLEALRNADEWTIIGYSMPGEDLMIKTLFIRALNGAPQKPAIKVVQLDDTFRSNYASLFGKHQFITGGVEQFLQVPQPMFQ